jgi:uncharacterized NAD(P)/FAD-binding protein YdhS
VDSLRPLTQAIWQRMPSVERERFLRHLQPYWDAHRHRVAERIGQVVADTRANGQLTVWAGRLSRFDSVPGGVGVEIAGRRGNRWTTEVARIINCTGPAVNVERMADPLVASLLAGGLGRPDTSGLGLETTTDGRLVNANGEPSQRMFSVGPMRRGELWETIAVPDIRIQAARLAEVLVSELDAG